MKDIPTAKELFDKMLEENDECTSTEMMIEFAKLHVEKALKEAGKKAKVNAISDGDTGYEYKDFDVNQDSILNSYPPSNIK
jgi:hypothetical protein